MTRPISSDTSALCGAVWLLALAALTLVAMGHNFAVGNHVIYLLWIERLRDPSFLAGDWYLSTPMMHPNIVIPLRYLGDWLGDANAFLAALALSRVLLMAGVWRLVRALGGTRVAGAIAALLAVFSPRVSLGGHYASGSFFEASHLGLALATLSLAFLVERRYLRAGLWLGATIHVHLFLGAHVAAIAALAVLWIAPGWKRRAGLLARIAIPAFALGAYTLWQSAGGWFGAPQAGALSGSEVVEVLAFRHPHHHSPLSWDLWPSLLFMAYIVLGMQLARRAERWREPVYRALFAYGAAAIVIGTVFVEWIPLELVAIFQFFRVTVLLMIWASAEIGLWLWAWIENSRNRGRAENIIPALLAFVTFRVPVIFLPVAFLMYIYEFIYRYPGEESGQGIIPLYIRQYCLQAGIFFLIMSSLLLLAGAQGNLNPLFALAGRSAHFRTRIESPSNDVNALAQWLRENTPEDAKILAPPGMEGLQLYARRSVVVSFKQVTFTPDALRAWFERIVHISLPGWVALDIPREEWGNPDVVLDHLREIRRMRLNPQLILDAGYDTLANGEAMWLANNYDLDYYIRATGERTLFRRIAQVGGYDICSLDDVPRRFLLNAPANEVEAADR